jgi:hypothetical protein
LFASVAGDVVNRFADPRPLATCDVCGSDDFADKAIHDGQSTIRTCRRCERLMGFPRWHSQALDVRPGPS